MVKEMHQLKKSYCLKLLDDQRYSAPPEINFTDLEEVYAVIVHAQMSAILIQPGLGLLSGIRLVKVLKFIHG